MPIRLLKTEVWDNTFLGDEVRVLMDWDGRIIGWPEKLMIEYRGQHD